MNLRKYENKLLRNLGNDAVELFKSTNAIIAGGAITSIFSGSEINDYDIYFRTKKDIITFIRNAFCNEGDENDENEVYPLSEEDFLDIGMYEFVCVNQTSRSITFTHNGLNIQLIHFDYYNTAYDIFENYDFHINMGAYDFKLNQFVLHDDFLTSIAGRRLTFNTGTRYPIMSMLRISKYLDRGYNISKKEMFKVGLAIANLNIDSWDTLEDQLSGFYGIDVSNMFDRTQPFSIDSAIVMIDKLQDVITQTCPNSPSIEQLFFTIMGNPYKEQRIFFGVVVPNKEEQGYIITGTDVTCELNVKFDIKNLPVDVKHQDLYKPRYYFGYSNNQMLGVFKLEENGHKMKMGYSGLELSGEITLIAVKPLQSN